MRIRSYLTLALAGGATAALAVSVMTRDAHSSGHERSVANTLTFDMIDSPVGRSIAPVPVAPPVSTHGSTIASWGEGVIAIDGDSGELVRLNAKGEVTASLFIGKNASQLAVDRTRDRIYVADRGSDRICVITADPDKPKHLSRHRDIDTAAEPYGVALTPDGETLLVTTVADRQLSAYATDEGTELWAMNIGPEPRGVAVSHDGSRALVSYLSTGAVARVKLGDEPRLAFTPIPAGGGSQGGFGGNFYGGITGLDLSPNPTHFARGAFAVAYVGHDLAVVPHHSASPGGDAVFEDPGTYGGGEGPPMAFRVAFIAEGKGVAGTTRVSTGEIDAHLPRAVAYDGARDTLYIAGYGSDTVSAIARVSQSAVRGSWTVDVGAGCGPNGLDVTSDGDVVVYCALTRQVARIAAHPDGATAKIASLSQPVTKSALSERAQRGRELFRRGKSNALSFAGTLACAGCHPEARADGLSWRIEGKSLQTPLLAGRLVGTHPFKWDGQDPTLDDSLKNTVKRLGGTGINDEEALDLAAFLESVPAPRTATVADSHSVKRGKALFRDEQVGCATCHEGKNLSNGKLYDLADDLPKVDTPSLIGLAQSAPYYHDGSAPTLEALLLENGSIHGMGDTSQLTGAQVADLASYLRTL